LKDAQNKAFEALIFYSLDRLGRTTRIVLKIIDQLSKNDIKIVSCRENIDTSSPTGKFVLTIFAALTQLERDTIVERMQQGRKYRIKNVDGECGGDVPFGFKREYKKVVINHEQAETIRYIYKLYFVDKLSIKKITDKLNDEKIQSAKGGKWHVGAIHKILNKHKLKYLGGSRNGGPVNWPTIIDKRNYDRKEN